MRNSRKVTYTTAPVGLQVRLERLRIRKSRCSTLLAHHGEFQQVLEVQPYAQLRRKWNPNGGSRSKEISQCAFGYLELLQAGDGCGLGAVGDRAKNADVGDAVLIWLHLGRGDWELGDVDGEIRAGIVAVEEIEELRERVNLPALADLDRAGDAQVGLNVRGSAKFVEAGIHPVVPKCARCCLRW